MQKWVVANWKMNGSKNLLNEYKKSFKNYKKLIVCLPSVYLGEPSGLILSAQNIHQQLKGAYTGEISASMLVEFGVKYCLVGHSERRQYFHETNSDVRAKAETCLGENITPIICIGETLEQYEANQTTEVLERQLDECLPSKSGFWIAYEPVWAIGTGKTPTTDEISEVHLMLREKLPNTTLLYGGSVNGDNAATIFAIPNVDGALVGGASLDMANITKIYSAFAK
ncbi:MAG: triose-phosphate isomerase [Alphaproteobacteria bacterium]